MTGAGLPGNLANLPPMRRKWLLWQLAGFTGSDTENHAITFGEFVALHLLAWSPRVWRTIPAFAECSSPRITGGATAPAAAIAPWLNRPWFCSAARPDAGRSTLQAKLGRPSRQQGRVRGLQPRRPPPRPLRRPQARRRPGAREHADVHDLRRPRGGRRLEPQRPLGDKVYNREWGRFVVRNGLLAYTLMQAWGNDPAQFARDKPGKKVLDAIPAAVSRDGAEHGDDDIDILLGFDKTTTAQPKRIAFNYSLEGDELQGGRARHPHAPRVNDTRSIRPT